MRNVVSVLAGVAVCVAWCAGVASAQRQDAFAGRWAVTVTPEDGGGSEKPYDDTLTFAGGKFVSEKGKAKGFSEAAYEADLRGGQVQTFTATAKSAKEGSAAWTGTAAAGELTGQFVWTKADGSTATYAFKGTRKK